MRGAGRHREPARLGPQSRSRVDRSTVAGLRARRDPRGCQCSAGVDQGGEAHRGAVAACRASAGRPPPDPVARPQHRPSQDARGGAGLARVPHGRNAADGASGLSRDPHGWRPGLRVRPAREAGRTARTARRDREQRARVGRRAPTSRAPVPTQSDARARPSAPLLCRRIACDRSVLWLRHGGGRGRAPGYPSDRHRQRRAMGRGGASKGRPRPARGSSGAPRPRRCERG